MKFGSKLANYKEIISSILLKPIEISLLYFRPVFLLEIIKIGSKTFGLKWFFYHIRRKADPNSLRKKYNHKFQENIVMLSDENTKLYLNVNDHLGYKYYLGERFDGCLLWLGEKFEFSEPDILLDVGANVGAVCIPFANKFGSEIIAIEASKYNCSLLLKNAFVNSAKIQCFCNCAVDYKTAKENRYITFYLSNGNNGANSIFEKWSPSVSEKELEYVKPAMIDELVSDDDLRNIKLVKIDVEGAESMVLQGMKKILENNIPILFEYRVDALKTFLNDDGSDIVDLLSKNYQIYGVCFDGNNYSLSEFNSAKSYENVLALPAQKIDQYESILNS